MIGTKKHTANKQKKSKHNQPFFSKRNRKTASANQKPKADHSKSAKKENTDEKTTEQQSNTKISRLKKIGNLLTSRASGLNLFKQSKKTKQRKSDNGKFSEKAENETTQAVKPELSGDADTRPQSDAPLKPSSTADSDKQSTPDTVKIESVDNKDINKVKTVKEPGTLANGQLKEKNASVPARADLKDKKPLAEIASVPKKQTGHQDKTQTKQKDEQQGQDAVQQGSEKSKQAPAEKLKAEEAKQPKASAKDKKPPKSGDAAIATEEKTPPEPTLNSESSGSLLQSLDALPPSGFAQGVKQAGPLATNIQQKEKTELKEDLPVIEQPTGLPVKGDAPKSKAKTLLKKEKAPELGVKGSKEAQKINTEHPQTTAKANVANIPTPRPPSGEDQSFFQSAIKQSVKNLKTTDSSINTSAGERPNVELKGEANPQQNVENQKQSDTKLSEEQAKADTEISKDFGEEDIYPEMQREMMSPQIELAPPPDGVDTAINDLPATSSDVYSAFDQKAQVQIDEQIQTEMLKHDAEKQKMETDSEKEKQQGQEKIDQETAKVKAQQEAEQTKAKSQVGKHREDWKKENEQVKTEYADKSSKKKQEIDGQIDTEVKETDKKVDKELSQAEDKADKEKKKTEEDAKRKKKEAEEKNKKRSFWDRVASAISDFFDALKSALNTLFDGLRKLVKGIIELAKKAVNGLIELARKAVVGLIKAFGEALKAFVNLALAAFPEIAKKINGFIDKAVDVAVNVVNKLAEGLKKLASALLDAIGKALDFILAAYQAFYNLLLDALKFIAVGIIKILEGIANLVSAARQSPEHFFGQMSEELLGQDVTKPLPNERQAQPSLTAQVAQAKEHGEINNADAAFLNKGTYADGDFKVDNVLQNEDLPPEIMQQLSTNGDGVIEFGASNDKEHTVDALKQDLAGGQATADSGQATATAAAPSPAPTTQEGGDGLVGPFSGPKERAGHLMDQMWQGIKKWFSDNKVKIIAALVLGITGLILANILTGGAIMAALPLLMQVVSVFFAAEAIFKITKYFGKYLGNAFPGQIIEGAKNLARGLAAGAIELVFALLFGGKAVVKAVKSGAKAAMKGGVKGVAKAAKSGAKTAAKSYVKTNVKAAKDLGKVAKEGAQATLKNGKAMLKGVKNGFSKGAKSLDDLGKRLAKKFRFKKFKIEIKNRKWRLLGQMNPWVLLSTGELREVKKGDLDGSSAVGAISKYKGPASKRFTEPIDALVLGSRKGDDYAKIFKEFGETGIVDALAKKVAKGQMTNADIKWLLQTFKGADTEGKRLLSMLAKDSQTPWKLLRDTAVAAKSGGKINWAQISGRLRGMSGEITAELATKSGQLLLDGKKMNILANQVRTASGRVLDFSTSIIDDVGNKFMMEVKSFTTATWENSLDAFIKHSKNAATLSKEELQNANKIIRLIDQLKSGATHTGNKALLTVTDNITPKQMKKLRDILINNNVSFDILKISNTEVIRISKKIKSTLNIT